MSIRLVASDLDGTLFTPDHEPGPRTVRAVNALVDAGIIVAAVTGRSWHTGVEKATTTGARLDWFIGSNGGHRINLASGDMEERLVFDADEIVTLADDVNAALDGTGFGYEHHEGMWFDDRFIEIFPRSLDGGRRVNTVTHRPPDDIGKVFISHNDIRTTDLVDAVRPHVPDSMVVTTSGITFVEVTPVGADKGSALARLCAQLGVNRDEVVAFGDNHNDLTMLEWAGRGVAMGNAHDAVKEIADEVTATNADDGVARVLETLLG